MLPSTARKRFFGPCREPSVWSPRYHRRKTQPRQASIVSARGRPILAPSRGMFPLQQRRTPETFPPERPKPVSFDADFLSRFEESSKIEWIETNGLGGYASSTVSGANTRQYHGLLVVPYGKGGCRHVMLAKLDETLLLGGQSYELSCNRYPGVIHPEGYLLLSQFSLDPIPTYVYALSGSITVEKRVFMLHGSNTVVISYLLMGPVNAAELRVLPMVAAREFHELTLENSGVEKNWKTADTSTLLYRAYSGTPALRFSHNAARVDRWSQWYRQLEYDMDAARGLPFREDVFVPFSFSYRMLPGSIYSLIVSTEESVPAATEAPALESQERARRSEVALSAPPGDPLEAALAVASTSFLVSDTHSHTGVISGYHWFGEYCRDTLISLPGLTLVTGNFSKAKEILSAVSQHFSRGMLPNRFDERTGEPEYTSADASLWFVHAVQKYLSYTKDYEFVRATLYDKMIKAIEHYRRGNGRGIIMDRNGLLDVGTETNQMTWMNATVGDQPVTPHHGKAVEVNALWYNALKAVADLGKQFDDDRAHKLAALATVAKRSFQVAFWNGNHECLFDCVRKGEVDASIRPNQIFAVSLPYPVLEGDRAASVVNCAEKELLTPFGLRTLSPRDPSYHGRYEGNPSSRDEAYHQGTVWAWLLGPFITAYLRVHGRSQAAIEKARGFIEPFCDHLRQAGLGTVSEMFDGDPPHTARGCVSKALSVAELLRAYREDILGNKPETRKETKASLET